MGAFSSTLHCSCSALQCRIARASCRTFSSSIEAIASASRQAGGVVLLLVCASQVNAQTAGAGSNQRPEETAATALLESGKPREALGELDRAAAAFRRA